MKSKTWGPDLITYKVFRQRSCVFSCFSCVLYSCTTKLSWEAGDWTREGRDMDACPSLFFLVSSCWPLNLISWIINHQVPIWLPLQLLLVEWAFTFRMVNWNPYERMVAGMESKTIDIFPSSHVIKTARVYTTQLNCTLECRKLFHFTSSRVSRRHIVWHTLSWIPLPPGVIHKRKAFNWTALI